MQTPNLASAKFKPLFLPVMLTVALNLAGCSTDRTPPPPAISPGLTEPLACTEFPVLKFQPGKPGATKQDVLDALANPPVDHTDPLAWVRNVVGDTKSTRSSISEYAAARRALGCDEPATP